MSTASQEQQHVLSDSPESVPVEVLGTFGFPVSEISLTARQAIVLASTVTGYEDGLADTYSWKEVKTAEAALDRAVRAATTASWRGSAAEALDVDPVSAALHYVVDVQNKPMPGSFLKPKSEADQSSNDTKDDVDETDDAVVMSFEDMFGDDEDDAAKVPVGANGKELDDLSKDIAFHADQTKEGLKLLQADEELVESDATTITINTSRIILAALKEKVAALSDEPALQAEVKEIEKLVETAVPQTVTSLKDKIKEKTHIVSSVTRLCGTVAIASLTRFR